LGATKQGQCAGNVKVSFVDTAHASWVPETEELVWENHTRVVLRSSFPAASHVERFDVPDGTPGWRPILGNGPLSGQVRKDVAESARRRDANQRRWQPQQIAVALRSDAARKLAQQEDFSKLGISLKPMAETPPDLYTCVARFVVFVRPPLFTLRSLTLFILFVPESKTFFGMRERPPTRSRRGKSWGICSATTSRRRGAAPALPQQGQGC
jgi:hypothetical protein